MVVRFPLPDADIDRLFRALADATRRDIVARLLADEPASVSSLASHYDMSFAAVQKHVAVLDRAGLLTKRRHGREQLVSGEVAAVRSVAAMLGELEQIWRGRVSRIDDLIASEIQEDPPCQWPTSITTWAAEP